MAKTLKEHSGFIAGMIVYLKSDFKGTMPMVVKTILETSIKKLDADIATLDPFGSIDKAEFDESETAIMIICQHCTSQKNILTQFLDPAVLTKTPGKPAE